MGTHSKPTGRPARARVLPPPGTIACLAACVLLLAGCGSVAKLAYENVDWLLVRRMDSYANFTPAQRDAVEAELAALHNRHRVEELPRVAKWLRDVRGTLARGPSREEVDELSVRARVAVMRHVKLLAPVVARALSRLDEEQIAHLERATADGRREYADEFIKTNLTDYAQARADRTVARLRDWLGYLTDAQLELVTSSVLAMPATGPDWLDYHRVEQDALIEGLRRGDGLPEILARIDSWLALERLDSAVARRTEDVRERWRTLIMQLAETLEPEQRASALSLLDGYIDAVESLLKTQAA